MNRTFVLTLACGLAASFANIASAQYRNDNFNSIQCPLANNSYPQFQVVGDGVGYLRSNALDEYTSGFCTDGSCSTAVNGSGHTSSCGPNGCPVERPAFGYEPSFRQTPNAAYGRQWNNSRSDYSGTYNTPRTRSNAGHYVGDGHNHAAEHYEGDGHNHSGHFPGDGHNHGRSTTNDWNRGIVPNSPRNQPNGQVAPLSQGPPSLGTLNQSRNTNRRPVDNGNFF